MTRRVRAPVCSVLGVLLIWVVGCSKDSTSPGLAVSISLGVTQGCPGEMIPFSCGQALSSPEEFRLRFGQAVTPVLGGVTDRTYEAMVPVVSPGTVSVQLEHTATGAVSNSVSFTVLPLPQTGQPPGALANEVLASQKESFQTMRHVIVPKFVIASGLSTTNAQALQAEIARAIDVLDKAQTLCARLSDSDRQLLDQLLFSAGVLDLVDSSSTVVARAAREMEAMGLYSGHYACAAMDGFSAILTVVRKVWSVAGLVASAGSGGSLAAAVVAGAVGMAVIDEGIDAYLPTDLNGLRVESEGELVVPVGGVREVRILGRFTTQSNPLHGTIREFVSALCALAGIGSGLESFILDTFAQIGINVADDLSSLTANWHTVDYVEHRVDPVYYEAGLMGFLNVLANQLGVSISNANSQPFLHAIAGFDYRVEHPSVASFDEATSSLRGLQAGSSRLLYNGYRFRPLSSWAGVIGSLLGLEWPKQLSADQINAASIVARQMTGNTVHVRSTPTGASVYLDGTNMRRTTPTTLENVPSGQHHVRLYLTGYNEYNATFLLADGGVFIIDSDLGVPLPPIPVFAITSPTNGERFTSNVITVSGSIRLQDAAGNTSPFTGNRAILTLNGLDKELNVSQGNFSERISIRAGANTLRLRANSPDGDTGASEELVIYGNFQVPDIEIVLTWNTPTSDLDLHVWNPRGEHCYYGHKVISDGSLDIDITEGFGPETFTAPRALSGIYVVKVNCYSLDRDPYADATVVIRIRGQEYGIFGPHHFTVHDRNGDDPRAWWHVASFSVVGGAVQPVDGELPEWLAERVTRDMQNLPSK